MIKKLKNNYLWILIILFVNSCSTLKLLKQNDNSIIAISATSIGLGAKGFGIIITLENLNTHQTFKSTSFSPISSHSVIQNIPSGKYIVRKVEVPVGNIMYSNWSENLTDFFGVINIKPNSKYYLGNFIGKRDVGKKNVLRLRLVNLDIPSQIKDKIENENTGWKSGEFIMIYPYEKEEFIVY